MHRDASCGIVWDRVGSCGIVRVRAWTQLHPKTHGQHAQRAARGWRPIGRGTLLLVAVSRLPQQTRQPQALGLWWHAPPGTPGADVPDLDRVWRAYVRRYDLEHTFRFPETNAQWDHPAGAPPRTSRPLDLARRAGLHPVAPGATAHPRSSAALAASSARRQADPGARPTRGFAPPATAARPGARAKTLWTLPWASQRQTLGARDALSGPHQGPPQRVRRRLNQATRSSFSSQRPPSGFVARLLMVKSQAQDARPNGALR